MKRYNLNDLVLFIYNPKGSSLLGQLNEILTYYDIIGDKPEFKSTPSWITSNHNCLVNNIDSLQFLLLIFIKNCRTKKQ